MKNVKRLFTASLIFLVLVASAYAALLPRDGAPGFPEIQVFTPTEIVTIAAAGDVTVSTYKVISFDNDITLYLNQLSTKTYLWPANRPLGIAAGITTIHVDAAVSMAVMQ